MSKRLVLFAEGDGECTALPILAKKLITERNAWGALHLDPQPFRVGEVSALAKKGYEKWIKFLGAALKRSNVGSILVVLDGDTKYFPAGSQSQFCASRVAKEFAEIAASRVGAGKLFSLAIVFACMEYESWLIAGVESLAGLKLSSGRDGIMAGVSPPPSKLEVELRGAKEWLSRNMKGGYNAPRDQADLTQLLNINLVRQSDLRSFRRLDHAMDELIKAMQTGQHVCSPV